MRKGRTLERLVRQFESLLIGDENVTISSPRRLRDKVTNRLREHDVVIELKKGHHTNVIAFECRDRSRPVGVDAVEAFYTKCSNTGVDKGIIVSANGFTKPAKQKADFYSIECFDLEHMSRMVTKNLIMLCNTISFNTTEVKGIHWNFLSADGVTREGGQWKLVDPFGNEVNPGMFNQQAVDQFNAHPELQMSGKRQITIGFPTSNLFILDLKTNERVGIKQAVATLKIDVRRDEVPLEHFKYSRRGNSEEIGNFSLGRQQLSGKELSLVFKTNANGQVELSLYTAEDDKEQS